MPRTTVDRFEQRRATRTKLVEAALDLFSTSGYEHATVDDIAQAAGYSKGAYYFHFSTKDDILMELLRQWTEERGRMLAGAVEDARSQAGLTAALAGFLSYEEAPRWRKVLLEFWAQATRNAEVSKRLTEAYAVWRKELAEIFEAAAKADLIAATPSELASVALAAHDGYAVQIAIGAPGGTAMSPMQLAESLLQTQVAGGEERQAAAR
jgi:AcrR family transcriptional regulator